MQQLGAFWRDEGGATAIEYGLIAGAISLAIMLTISQLGVTVFDLFQLVAGIFN
ncbi:MAG: Flp family type IVb pilin [Methyloligellaceae bacterium]